MHIALVNAFPSIPSTAEIEYIWRFKLAAANRGHVAYEVVTSDDIHCCKPDFVIATHEYTPKLTPFFTLGALWSPPTFYATDPLRIRSILSYDGYLVGSSHVSQFLDDLEFSTGHHKPRSDFLFLPTAPERAFVPREPGQPYELVYVGVHWDGKRHGGLLDLISEAGLIALYGPSANWRGFGRSYRGEVPYDGVSMQRTLARHGIALCLHKTDHRSADTPSMRLFEAAAAGCLIITDEIPFAERVLGDSVFRIDLRDDPAANARKIGGILAWANAHPEQAGAMARSSHEILNRDFSLERIIDQTCDFVVRSKDEVARRYRGGARLAAAASREASAPLVDIIVRTGGRELGSLRRALRSVADQQVGRYRVILADYRRRADVAALAREEATCRLAIDYVGCDNTGLRSSTLWAGLERVTAPYFAMLDDDDALMPDHFGHLLATAQEHPDHPLYYSGVVRVEEDPIDYMDQPNFAGPMDIVVPEVRELKFMDRFDLVRLLNFDNFIQSNAWIARSSCLDERALIDPRLIVAEDMYLYLLLARHGSFRLSPLPTAYWNWRSGSLDNSMNSVDPDVWKREVQRMEMRLDQEMMADGYRFAAARSLVRSVARPSNVATRELIVLDFNETRPLHQFVLNPVRANLHEAEQAGIWTSGTQSLVRINLKEPVTDVSITLGFMAAASKDRPQAVDITINGQPLYQGPVEPWRWLEARNQFHFPVRARSLFLKVRSAYSISPAAEGSGHDRRWIGVLLSSISCTRTIPALTAPKKD